MLGLRHSSLNALLTALLFAVPLTSCSDSGGSGLDSTDSSVSTGTLDAGVALDGAVVRDAGMDAGGGEPDATVDPCRGRPVDRCGVCDGDGTSCLDCAGTPFGDKELDACGVCGGDGLGCRGCDDVPNSNKMLDACGVCDGDGSSCAGCDGVSNSGKVVDACGVCGGDGSSCAGCDGVSNSGKVVDECGVCDGTGIAAGACDCAGTLPATWYGDADGDGLGDPAVTEAACTKPDLYVDNDDDKDPVCGAVGRDVCGVCGGSGIPAGDCDCEGAKPRTFYGDADDDGLGDPSVTESACEPSTGYVGNDDDTDPSCGEARDRCDECGGDGSSCHPLTGRYAVRTVLYARQKADVLGSQLDLVSKGVLMSIADIDETGLVNEHYCFIEIVNEQGIFSWTLPESTENIPDSRVQLVDEGGAYVRALEGDLSYVSWSPDNVPADCTAGQTHSSGCLCPENDRLPTDENDCRVLDLDSDTVPGGAMYVGVGRPLDPATDTGLVKLNIVGTKGVAWRLDPMSSDTIVGSIEGGIEQSELSREGDPELLAAFGAIRNSVCPGEYGHVQLVLDDDIDCDALMAGRAVDVESHGIFDTSFDGDTPVLEVCPDPDACRGEVDECGVCDGPGIAPGECDCEGTLPSSYYGDSDGDGLGDPSVVEEACTQPVGYVSNSNDTDPVCGSVGRDVCGVCGGSGIPQGQCNCQGAVLDECNVCGGSGIPQGKCDCQGADPRTFYGDSDGDGLGDARVTQTACTQPTGYVNNASDTDPACGSVGRDECNVCGGSGIPQGQCNCQGAVLDECGVCGGSGIPQGACDCQGNQPDLWYDDTDRDGLGNPAISVEQCAQPTGFVSNANDTDPACGSVGRDECGVCGGSGIPQGQCNCQGATRDECGVCGGDGIAQGACDCEGNQPGNWYEDRDGDGLGDPAIVVRQCAQPTGFVSNANDTDPACGSVGRDECGVCGGSGIPAGDCDCAGNQDDACGVCDGDGSSCAGCDGVPNSGKVIDACGVCGGDDSSCAGCDGVPGSGKVDDECGVCGGTGIAEGRCDCQGTLPRTWYGDADGDGLGAPSVTQQSCTQPGGYVGNANDTDPGCGSVGRDECNVCGGSGIPQDACDCQGTGPRTWYGDADGDGLGDPSVAQQSCTQPSGYVGNASDTDPGCGSVGRDECNVCGGSGIPQGQCNCQGAVVDACGVCGGSGIPQNACDCQGTAPRTWYRDVDGDGLGDPAVSTQACAQPSGYVGNANDTDPSCGGTRDVCDVCNGPGIPQGQCNCQGGLPATWYGDADGDGLGDPSVTLSSCTQPSGYVANANDTDPSCGGSRDACGVCDGPGFPEGACDCDGSVADACGVCGGDGTSCLVGTYAVRGILFTKGRAGTTTSVSKAINYSLITIAANGDGTLTLSDQSCYSETLPISGTQVYSWSKPSWMAKLPIAERQLTPNGDGTFTREGIVTQLGWSIARQPPECTAETDGQLITTASGASCRCNLGEPPPYGNGNDCRVFDQDEDGLPGISAFASTGSPSNPEANASGLSWARLGIASNAYNTWKITPAEDGRHTGEITDASRSSIVACSGGGWVNACSQVNGNPVNNVCPAEYNTAVFIPVESGYTCGSVVSNRSTLFRGVTDPATPNNTVCPAP
jgi:hypothetical protein